MAHQQDAIEIAFWLRADSVPKLVADWVHTNSRVILIIGERKCHFAGFTIIWLNYILTSPHQLAFFHITHTMVLAIPDQAVLVLGEYWGDCSAHISSLNACWKYDTVFQVSSAIARPLGLYYVSTSVHPSDTS